MITLLRNGQRRYVQRGKQEVRRSIFAKDHSTPIGSGFDLLVAFDELMLSSGGSTEPHADDEAEVITYVYKGALSQQDTAGNTAVVHAGEFQRRSTGRLIRHRETSVSRSNGVHLFRISLRPSEVGLDREQEQKQAQQQPSLSPPPLLFLLLLLPAPPPPPPPSPQRAAPSGRHRPPWRATA